MPCEGQALALRVPGCVFFRSAGACPPRSLILDILIILAILLQTRERLRSSRTFSACCAEASIDIKVFQTFFSLILAILIILAILLQTEKYFLIFNLTKSEK